MDTVVYAACSYGLAALSVANPASPYMLDSLDLGGWPYDVIVVGSKAYVGGDGITAVDISNVRDLRIAGRWSAPNWVRRLSYASPCLYAACFEGGVCVVETLAVGIAESDEGRLSVPGVRAQPSVTSGLVFLSLPEELKGGELRIYTSTGRLVGERGAGGSATCDAHGPTIDLSNLPDGVYFITCRVHDRMGTVKVSRVVGR
jgi:hypothetical protein